MADSTAGQLESVLRVNKASAKAFEPRSYCITVIVLASFLVHFRHKSSKTTGNIFHDRVSEPTSQL